MGLRLPGLHVWGRADGGGQANEGAVTVESGEKHAAVLLTVRSLMTGDERDRGVSTTTQVIQCVRETVERYVHRMPDSELFAVPDGKHDWAEGLVGRGHTENETHNDSARGGVKLVERHL